MRALTSQQCWSLLLLLSLVLRGFSTGTWVYPLLNQEWLMKNHYVDVLPLNCYLFIYSFIIKLILIDSFSSRIFLPLIFLNLLGTWLISVWGGVGWDGFDQLKWVASEEGG